MLENCKRLVAEVQKSIVLLESAWSNDRAERRQQPNPTDLFTRHVKEAYALVFASGDTTLDALYKLAIQEAGGNKPLLFNVEKLKTAHREEWESAIQGAINDMAVKERNEALEGIAEHF